MAAGRGRRGRKGCLARNCDVPKTTVLSSSASPIVVIRDGSCTRLSITCAGPARSSTLRSVLTRRDRPHPTPMGTTHNPEVTRLSLAARNDLSGAIGAAAGRIVVSHSFAWSCSKRTHRPNRTCGMQPSRTVSYIRDFGTRSSSATSFAVTNSPTERTSDGRL